MPIITINMNSVVDPGGPEIICRLESGPIINFGSGFQSGSRLTSVLTNKYKSVKMYRF
jgi:hypothetical protein